MIAIPEFQILAAAIVNATQNPCGTADPTEITNAIEGVENFCLGLQVQTKVQTETLEICMKRLERLEAAR